MVIRELRVSGYRSVRELRLQLGNVNVLIGPNGCGKSNLYNSVFLLAKAANGDFARLVAEKGGMASLVYGLDLVRRALYHPRELNPSGLP